MESTTRKRRGDRDVDLSRGHVGDQLAAPQGAARRGAAVAVDQVRTTGATRSASAVQRRLRRLRNRPSPSSWRGRKDAGGARTHRRLGRGRRPRTSRNCVTRGRYPCSVRSTRGGASPMMVGRDHELHRMMRLVSSPRPHIAIVAGEPGIGKTRLINEFLAGVPEGTVVIAGDAQPGSLGRPYELLLDAIVGMPADEQLVRDINDMSRSPAERLRAAIAVVNGLIGDRPAVMVFEDLHWADAESTALFEHLADQPGARLLVGTYRPADVTRRQPVDALLARLERRHEVAHFMLGRLTPDETSQLLTAATGQPAPYRTVMALQQRTGGNPFYLEELLRGQETVDLETLCDQPLPWSLAEILRRQSTELEPRRRRTLEAAAVLGQRIPFDLLASVTGAGEEELIDTLRDLVDRGVLIESGDDEFVFRHALVREAITGSLLRRERRRLHEAALDALLARDSEVNASGQASRAHGDRGG